MSVFNFNSGKNMSAYPQIQNDLTATNLNLHCDPRTVGTFVLDPQGKRVLDVSSTAGKIAAEDNICDLPVANLTGTPSTSDGVDGVDGVDGATGPQGPIGLTGADGSTGPQGPIGLTGATGPNGPLGLTGPQGPTGLTGVEGGLIETTDTIGAGTIIKPVGLFTHYLVYSPSTGEIQMCPLSANESIAVTSETEINIFFGDSGSMSSTLVPLNTMRSDLLRECLLPFYNNNVTLYNERVTITNEDDERAIRWISTQPTDPSYNVVNLAFADESNIYEAESPSTNGWVDGTSTGNTDIALLRTNLEAASTSKSHRGIIFQVDKPAAKTTDGKDILDLLAYSAVGGGAVVLSLYGEIIVRSIDGVLFDYKYPTERTSYAQVVNGQNMFTSDRLHSHYLFQISAHTEPTDTTSQYQAFMDALFNGKNPHIGVAGLSDKSEVSCVQDTIAGSTPEYYLNLIVTAMNNLGYTIPNNVSKRQ